MSRLVSHDRITHADSIFADEDASSADIGRFGPLISVSNSRVEEINSASTPTQDSDEVDSAVSPLEAPNDICSIDCNSDLGEIPDDEPKDFQTVQLCRESVTSGRTDRMRSNGLSEASDAVGSEVTLHVYDLSSWTRASKLPFFHLGVQVYRLEYFFCCLGIQTCAPTKNTGHIFKESVLLGRTALGLRDVLRVLRQLGTEWTSDAYNLLGHNCQSFVVTFCRLLGLEDPIPKEYSRFSEIADLPSQLSGMIAGAASSLIAQPFQACNARNGTLPSTFFLECANPDADAPTIYAHVSADPSYLRASDRLDNNFSMRGDANPCDVMRIDGPKLEQSKFRRSHVMRATSLESDSSI